MPGNVDAAASLVISGLRKSYGGVRAMVNVDMEARPGTIHALLGENGAGKSTLIKTLSGVVAPDGGTVSLNGSTVELGRPLAARAAGIRTAFQELSQVPDLTVAENLVFERPPRNALGQLSRHRLNQEAEALLSAVDADRLHAFDVTRPLRELSLAHRQVLEVARALSYKPRVLILDEATSALPTEESNWVIRQAKVAAAHGAAVLFISHRLDEVREVATHMTVMRGGRSIQQGLLADFSDDELVKMMLGERAERLYVKHATTVGDVILEADGLSTPAGVDHVSFQLRAGEILGLGGLEGQGQREVLLALAGAIPSAGTVLVASQTTRFRSPADAMGGGIVLVPEDRQREALFLTHSIQYNMTLSSLASLRARDLSIDKKREKASVAQFAQRFSIDQARLEDPVGALSGGNQQKVVLARALMTKPRVVLLYDCTRGVDVGTKSEIHALIAELAEEGVAVVVYASDMSELVHLCDRVVVLNEGAIVGEVAKADLSESAILHLAVGTTASPPSVGKTA